MKVRWHQIQTMWSVWEDSPVKIGCGLQTALMPGVIVLQEEVRLKVQFSQHHNVVMGVDYLVQVPKNPEGLHLSYLKRQCTSLYPLKAVS